MILILINSFIVFSYKQCNERSIGSIKPIYDLIYFKNKFKNESLKEKKEILNNTNFRINMSVETLLVSLEITFESLLNNPFGVGFNKYHLAHREYIDQIIKTDNSVKKNNIYDGSTNISKIVTEFGIFGILLILFFLFTLLKRQKLNQFDIFLISLICMQFLRGVGYFNGGFVLIFIVYFYKFHKEKLKSI